MENPVSEISHVIHLLAQSPPSIQQRTVERYFTPDAAFTHPFCRTGSFSGSRWLVLQIYRWYKILSPRIELEVKSVAFDADNLLLYVTVSQIFRLFFVPYYSASVTLTTVLTLTTANDDAPSDSPTDPAAPTYAEKVANARSPRYWITDQNDLYQTSEFIKFVVPYGIGVIGVLLWQFFATFCCVLGAKVFAPISWLEENYGQHAASESTAPGPKNGNVRTDRERR